MKRWYKLFAVLVVCLLALGSIGYLGIQHSKKAAYAAGTFTPIDLGTRLTPIGISNDGTVLATYNNLYGSPLYPVTVNPLTGQYSYPTSPTGSVSYRALSINASTNEIAGTGRYYINGSYVDHGVIWSSNGTATDLGGPTSGSCDQATGSTIATAVNDLGDVVGYCSDSNHFYAGYWPGGAPNSFTKLPNIGNSNTLVSEAAGINHSGTIVGHTIHATVWRNGIVEDINPSDSLESEAKAINDSGLVVGEITQTDPGPWQPYVWDLTNNTNYNLYTISGQGGATAATAVSNSGIVVGYDDHSGGFGDHPFMWKVGSSYTDLNSLIDPTSGWTLISAVGVNSSGQIVGWGTLNSVVHTYVLNTSTPSSYRLSLAPASQTATIGGGQGLVTATLLDSATNAPASNVKLSFRVETGPNAGMSGTCLPSSCTTDANGQVEWGYRGTTIGVDTVQAWMDTNGNGVPDTGEPQTTAGVQWTAATCQDAVFIAATGSDQQYTSDTNLKISPQLNSVYKAMMSRLAGRKSVRVQVLDYPALSVNVLTANLNTGTFSARWHQFFGVNLPKYLAGKDKGVAALWGAVTKVRFTCPNQKIVLVGYSQGAMVVHEFLEELAATNDTATKSAIRGVVLVADPERVKHSQVLEFGDAAWSAMGICNFPGVTRFTSCSGPLQLTDVPAAFRSVTTDVCFQYDIVCDTGELFHDFNVNTQSGYIEAVKLGTFIHTGLYQGSPKTTTAGYRAANLLLASR